MIWTEEHGIMLCREILIEELYNFKHWSRERGRCWDLIADTLSKVDQPKFNVDQRVVRYRFVKLEKASKKKTKEDLRSSGIALNEPSELDQALEEIIEKINSAEQQKEASCAEKQQEINKEKETRRLLGGGQWKDCQRSGQGKDVGKGWVERQVSI